jgi:hypothetical protein
MHNLWWASSWGGICSRNIRMPALAANANFSAVVAAGNEYEQVTRQLETLASSGDAAIAIGTWEIRPIQAVISRGERSSSLSASGALQGADCATWSAR